jgi:4-amino-4-deoxy-L-arabinose transferase-like glycosyltransferase
MSSQIASHPAHIRAPAPIAGVADALRAIGAQFYLTTPYVRDRIGVLWCLAALTLLTAVVRFWGLGAVGLHGDEETMAMAARHILVDGRPILPSGMFYPRGLTQLYLMALSASVFGESEWAWRAPSVFCGVLLTPLAYLASRRYLRPTWSLAFAAAVAFLPALIIDSQTARMYIFLVTLITAMLACVHAWERTDRTGWLFAGVVCLVLGLDMHALAVAAALIFLAPGLARGDARKLLLGGCATLAVIAAYFVIHTWVQAQYPTPSAEFASQVGPSRPSGSLVPRDFQLAFDLALWASGLVIAFFAVWTTRTVASRLPAAATTLFVFAAIVLQLLVYYHLAALAYLASSVLAIRYGDARTPRRVALLLAAAAVVLLVHATLLAPVSGTFVRLVGALIGDPSMWPYVRLAELSPVAALVTAALLGWGCYQLAHRRALPDYWLLAVLGVWAPVFALGAFAWNVPPRYTEMSLPPMLLCAFAASQAVVDRILARRTDGARARWSAALAAACAVALVNPVASARTVNSGYRTHPDHKGAAEFVRSLNIVDEDIILAEDVLQQTYYLGAVDYWLIGPDVARRFVKRAGDRVVDFYTGTPVIATPAMLDELLQENADKRVIVIGSGEDQRSRRRAVRGPALHAAIESDRFVVLHTGRDGLTRVLQAAPRAAAASPTTKAASEADAQALVESVPATQGRPARVAPAAEQGH